MHRTTLLLSLILHGFLANAQTFEWPIAGHRPGDGIISQPQQYIEGQLNYEELYISAPLGAIVISPVDGKISDLYVAEKRSRFEVRYWDVRKNSFDETISNIIGSDDKAYISPKYLSGYIAIKTSDGDILQIGGLRGANAFETGMHVSKGDTLGVVGYDYKAFTGPHISLILRNTYMDPLDPLEPFGLQSKFIPLKESKAPEKLSREDAKEDLNILFDAYRECYPLIYGRLSEEKFLSYRDSCLASLDEIVDYVHFYYMVRATTTEQFINDSHLSLLTHIPVTSENYLAPQFRLGVLNDSLIVVAAPQELSQYLTRTVRSINGVDSDIWIHSMHNAMNGYDSNAFSSKCVSMLNSWNLLYGEDVHSMTSQKIVFSDGEVLEDRWVVNNSIIRVPEEIERSGYYRNQTESYNNTFTFSQPCDSVKILMLSTFSLDEGELKEIKDSLLSFVCPNLIIDLRNNAGGNEEIMGELLSLLVDRPIKNINPYYIVNDTCSYNSFKYSSNFPVNAKPFSEYEYDKSKGGYCHEPDWLKYVTTPTKDVYHGKIYLLIGESTFSAAALFASYLVRADRAVSIGRETPASFHDMRANKFLDLRLPNSRIDIRIPLVKCVFDEMVTERTPAGRGLLPDYFVPVSFNEVYCDTNDLILEKAIEIISHGKYINHKPFASDNGIARKKSHAIPLLCCLFLILSIYSIKRKINK